MPALKRVFTRLMTAEQARVHEHGCPGGGRGGRERRLITPREQALVKTQLDALMTRIESTSPMLRLPGSV